MYTLYTKENCPYCVMAKDLLDMIGEEFVTFDVTKDGNMDKVNAILGYNIKTVPQIFHDGKHVGGYTDLQKYLES